MIMMKNSCKTILWIYTEENKITAIISILTCGLYRNGNKQDVLEKVSEFYNREAAITVYCLRQRHSEICFSVIKPSTAISSQNSPTYIVN